MATKPQRRKGVDLDDAPVDSRERGPRIDELVQLAEFPHGKWVRIRLFGDTYPYGTHWVKTKKKDGGEATFPTPCLAFDGTTGRKDSTLDCPWCDHTGKEIRFSTDYFVNGIMRGLKAPRDLTEPTDEEAESGLKQMDSDTWTPIRAVRMPSSLARAVKELKSLNVHETESGSENFSVLHPKFGCDILVKFNKDATPAQRYTVQLSDKTPLTKAEKAYLIWDLSDLQQVPSLEETKKEYTSWSKRNGHSSEDEDDDDDGVTKKPKSKRPAVEDDDDAPPPKAKSKRPPVDDDDDAPPPKKGKRPPVVDDEDDDEPTPPKSKGRKPPVDDDDDDDDDDDAPPKKKVVSKRPPVVDDDDDDDAPPPPKKAKRPPVDEDDDDAPPPPKKGKRPPVDEEDDDPPPPKPKSKRPPVDEDDEEPPPPKKGKRPPVNEDDDEDDDPPPPPRKARR